MITKTIQEIHQMIQGKLILNEGSLTDVVSGVTIDSRVIDKGNLYVAINGERVDGHTFVSDVESKNAALALISNEAYVPKKMPVIIVENTVEALQKLAAAYRDTLHAHIIGITGSNGKTSCKDILAGALSGKFKTQKTLGNKNNEIGVPLTLLSLDADVEAAVIEMGMENLEEIHFLNTMVKQEIAIITNVGIAHLENLGTIENIAKAKLEIVDVLKKDNLFIYYGEDCALSSLMKHKQLSKGVKVVTFGKESGDLYLTKMIQKKDGIYFSTNLSDTLFHIDILGEHQALNALSAIAVCYELGLNDEQIQKGFHQMEKTSMRNELVHIKKCTILNDAYKSNPQSAKAALDTFEKFRCDDKIVVLGDMLELGSTSPSLHYDLGASLKQYHLNEVVCVGEMSKYIAEGARTIAGLKISEFDTREDVFEYLKEYINKDCMILFKGSRGMALDLIIDKMKEYGDKYE